MPAVAAVLLAATAPAAGEGAAQPANVAAKRKPPAVPRAAYVIRPGVGFRIGVRGRALGRFLLPVKCADRMFRISRIPIERDGSFRFHGRTRGAREVTIRVVGRFRTRATAVGEIRLVGRGCPARPTRFVARLS